MYWVLVKSHYLVVLVFLLHLSSASNCGYTCCRFSQRIYNKYFVTTQVSNETCVVTHSRPGLLWVCCNPAVRLNPVEISRRLILTGSQPDGCEKWPNWSLLTKTAKFGCFGQKCVCCVWPLLEKCNGPASVPQTVSGNSRLQFAAQMRAHCISPVVVKRNTRTSVQSCQLVVAN